MTDHERAVAFARAAIGEAEVGTTDLLVAEFAAVRLEERAAIVDWLRAMAESRRRVRNLTPIDRSVLLDSVADAVERGEHVS